MAANIDRFKKDLDRLIHQGDLLDVAMILGVSDIKDSIIEQIREQVGDNKKADEYIKGLPNFTVDYQSWYSECIALIRQLLPDRVDNFISHYEKPKNRKEVNYGNYVIQDYMQSLRVTYAGETKVDSSAAVPQFRQQVAILKATRARFESSLFEIRQIVQADLFDSELDAAQELHGKKFYRAAGAIAGVVLEKHLHQICEDHGIKITKKNPGISVLNDFLKENGVIDIPTWRHISMLGDIRNICDHNKKIEPSDMQVKDLVDGTAKVLKTIA